MSAFRPVIVIPHFNHHRQLAASIEGVRKIGVPLIIVDDGSEAASVSALKRLTSDADHVELVTMPRNRGKGATVKTGLLVAASRGFTHALQIDADGQHCAADGQRLLSAARERPSSIICGLPQFDDSIPKARLRGRALTHFWVRIETLGARVKDAMCGFRVYPLAVIEPVLDGFYTGPRMDFDIEVLVKADWIGVPLHYVPTAVQYPEDGLSHFDYVRDNVDITIMHIRLVLGMLPRSGKLVWRLLGGR